MNHKPYKNLTNSKKEQIVTMFDRIAKTYDRLNGLITFGMDKAWRRSVATMILAKNPTSILDVATGTGALAIDLATQSSVEVVGIDGETYGAKICSLPMYDPEGTIVRGKNCNIPEGPNPWMG